jgi:cyclophilin family peptidyl-prolyl cis-trans isomerase
MRHFIAFLIASLVSVSAFSADPRVEIKTSLGTMIVELDKTKAPKSVENFLAYTKDGFYNGTIFHRVIDGFMVQGGGFTADMNQKKTRDPIENEAKNGLKNVVGSLAMARTNAPHSATSQFFINLVNNERLDNPSFDGWGYAVFGKVVDGLPVLEKIAKVATSNAGMHQNVPTTPVVIESVRLIPEKK